MPMFEDRERAFEAKFAHDEEFCFLVTARRDKLSARRVSGQLELADQAPDGLVSIALALPDGPGQDGDGRLDSLRCCPSRTWER